MLSAATQTDFVDQSGAPMAPNPPVRSPFTEDLNEPEYFLPDNPSKLKLKLRKTPQECSERIRRCAERIFKMEDREEYRLTKVISVQDGGGVGVAIDDVDRGARLILPMKWDTPTTIRQSVLQTLTKTAIYYKHKYTEMNIKLNEKWLIHEIQGYFKMKSLNGVESYVKTFVLYIKLHFHKVKFTYVPRNDLSYLLAETLAKIGERGNDEKDWNQRMWMFSLTTKSLNTFGLQTTTEMSRV